MVPRLSSAASAAGLLAALATSQVPSLYDPDIYREFRLTFSQSNWWSQLVANYGPEIDIPADLVVDGKTYKNVGVRFRGNTSYTQLPAGSEKKCFNILTDEFTQGQDLYGYTHLNLNNGFHDPTFMREFIGYWICRKHGIAPKANFIKLYLNNVYWGVYLSVEQPNSDMMKEWFRSNDGNRYRCFPTSGTFGNGRCAYTWLGSAVSSYLSAYQAKQGDGTDLMNMCNVLNNTPAAQLQAALPAVFSVDQFYRYASCMNVMTNDDSYIGSGKDHYLFKDTVYGAFHTFPFDLNETLARSTSMSPTLNTTGAAYPAFSKTLQLPDWNQRYLAHYRTVFEDTVNWAYLGPIITQYYTMITPGIVADTKKIYTTQAFYDNMTLSVSTTTGVVPGLKTQIDNRYAFLKAHALFQAARPTLANLVHSPANPIATSAVTVTVDVSSNAAAVKLFSRSAGPFTSQAMYDDGNHGDGQANDGTWGVILPAQPAGTLVDYYVEATTSAGTASYWPKNAELFPPSFRVDWPTAASPVKINELLAQNVTGIVDENNQHEDWVELYNSSNQAVNVGGWYLTDNLLQAKKFQIPASTSIPAYGTLLVWADEDGTQGPMHANFKLSASGEELALFAADGVTRLDYVQFGTQQADIATGRLYDGSDPWVTLTPTPRLRNELAASGARKYSALYAPSHVLDLGLSAAPKINTQPALTVAGGPASGLGLLVAAPLPAYYELAPLQLGSITLLLDAPSVVNLGSFTFDGQGKSSLPLQIPNDPGLVGAFAYFQVFGAGATAVLASNGLEILVGL